jgi:hypothetical protein
MSPLLRDYVAEIGLPADFCERRPKRSRVVEEVVAEYERQLPDRLFLMGLVFAFIGVVEDLLSQIGSPRAPDALDRFPPETTDTRGRPRNTLYLQGPARGVGLRRYYNSFERMIWNRLKRFDYPNCAPHATQAWPQHRGMLERIFAMSPCERLALATSIWESALRLREARGRGSEAITPRPFEKVLKDFDNTQRGEPAGAVLQGLAFAYYRADAPNVTLETSKVGAGRARLGGVGDIDGWSGGKLVLSIEVKDADIERDDVDGLFGSFFGNLAEWPDATAIAVARRFDTPAKEHLAAQRLLVLDRATMLENIALWDLRKQELALREFAYFLIRVQRHSGLEERFRAFLEAQDLALD